MNYNLTFTIEGINLILKGLYELPAKESKGAIDSITNAVTEQENAAKPKQELAPTEESHSEIPAVENSETEQAS